MRGSVPLLLPLSAGFSFDPQSLSSQTKCHRDSSQPPPTALAPAASAVDVTDRNSSSSQVCLGLVQVLKLFPSLILQTLAYHLLGMRNV